METPPAGTGGRETGWQGPALGRNRKESGQRRGTLLLPTTGSPQLYQQGRGRGVRGHSMMVITLDFEETSEGDLVAWFKFQESLESERTVSSGKHGCWKDD